VEEKTKDSEKVLSDEILADARRRGERAVKRAEADAKKLIEQALAEAKAVGDAALADVERRLARERQVFDASLLHDERMRRLAVQGRLLDETFDRALERLRSREGCDYRAVVVNLAVEAIGEIGGDAFVLRPDAADLESMGATLPADAAASARRKIGRDVTVTAGPAAGRGIAGIIVESADGRRRVDNSFAERLRRMRDDLRFDVADVLFGSESPADGNVKLKSQNSKLK